MLRPVNLFFPTHFEIFSGVDMMGGFEILDIVENVIAPESY